MTPEQFGAWLKAEFTTNATRPSWTSNSPPLSLNLADVYDKLSTVTSPTPHPLARLPIRSVEAFDSPPPENPTPSCC